jgi:hypothetical protein
MNAQGVYRESAARALDLAQRAATAADKQRLIRLAERWLALDERVASLPAGAGLDESFDTLVAGRA